MYYKFINKQNKKIINKSINIILLTTVTLDVFLNFLQFESSIIFQILLISLNFNNFFSYIINRLQYDQYIISILDKKIIRINLILITVPGYFISIIIEYISLLNLISILILINFISIYINKNSLYTMANFRKINSNDDPYFFFFYVIFFNLSLFFIFSIISFSSYFFTFLFCTWLLYNIYPLFATFKEIVRKAYFSMYFKFGYKFNMTQYNVLLDKHVTNSPVIPLFRQSLKVKFKRKKFEDKILTLPFIINSAESLFGYSSIIFCLCGSIIIVTSSMFTFINVINYYSILSIEDFKNLQNFKLFFLLLLPINIYQLSFWYSLFERFSFFLKFGKSRNKRYKCKSLPCGNIYGFISSCLLPFFLYFLFQSTSSSKFFLLVLMDTVFIVLVLNTIVKWKNNPYSKIYREDIYISLAFLFQMTYFYLLVNIIFKSIYNEFFSYYLKHLISVIILIEIPIIIVFFLKDFKFNYECQFGKTFSKILGNKILHLIIITILLVTYSFCINSYFSRYPTIEYPNDGRYYTISNDKLQLESGFEWNERIRYSSSKNEYVNSTTKRNASTVYDIQGFINSNDDLIIMEHYPEIDDLGQLYIFGIAKINKERIKKYSIGAEIYVIFFNAEGLPVEINFVNIENLYTEEIWHFKIYCSENKNLVKKYEIGVSYVI